MATLAPSVRAPGRAEGAAAFYLAVFQRAGQPAEIRGRMRLGGEDPLIAVTAVLAGHAMILFNPLADVAHSHAASHLLTGATQAEVDKPWDGLPGGGGPVRRGRPTDRDGVSWQIVPDPVGGLLQAADPSQAERPGHAIQGMVRIDLPALEAASEA